MTPLRQTSYVAWLSTLFVCGACELNLSVVPVYTARPDAGMTAADGGRDAPPVIYDAGRDGGVDAHAGRDAARDGGDSQPLATKHAACEAAPHELPEVGVIVRDVKGRPAFDFWRDLACDEVGLLVECREDLAPASSWGCAQCIKLADGEPAVCAPYEASSALCADSKTTVHPAVYQGGACITCVPDALKRRLCCDGVEGVDCRAWPFDTLSKQHQVCARHADCEQGLVCRTDAGRGYGLCMCPEEAPDAFASAARCAGGMP